MKYRVEQTPPSVQTAHTRAYKPPVEQTPPSVQNAHTGAYELPAEQTYSSVETAHTRAYEPPVEQTPSSMETAHTGAYKLPVEQTPSSVQSNKIKEFTIHIRNLPHWQNPGSVYFITFRTYKGLILDDSSKQIIYDNIIHYSNLKYYLYSFVIMPDHVHIILQPNEINIGEYIGLSEIMQAIKGYAAKQILKYLKDNYYIVMEQTGASVLPNSHNKAPSGASVLPAHIFQAESFDRILRNEEELYEKMNYILNNPVKKGLIVNGYNYQWYYHEK